MSSLASSLAPSAAPSARQTPEPMAAQPKPQPRLPPPKKDIHADVEESREKEKRTTVGKIKAKIFGGSSRSERRPKSDGYSKKRDPRREKAYKCPVSIFARVYSIASTDDIPRCSALDVSSRT